jgi:Tfp pilus assembly protein PilZ
MFFKGMGDAMASWDKNLQDPTLTHQLFQRITLMSDDERRTLLKLLDEGLLKGRCRRAYFRKTLLVPIAYASERQVYRNFTKDISLGGVFISTHIPFKVGQQIRLVFNSADNTGPVGILGKVARLSPDGIGVKFISINQAKKSFILSLASRD